MPEKESSQQQPVSSPSHNGHNGSQAQQPGADAVTGEVHRGFVQPEQPLIAEEVQLDKGKKRCCTVL